jgi:DNA polymerase/3'-5' exonuclease PolX
MSIVIQNQVKLHRWMVWLLVKKLTKSLDITKYAITGSYRRGKWWCNDIDLLVPISTPEEGNGVIERVQSLGWKLRPGRIINEHMFSNQFVKKTSAGNVILDLFLVPPGCWGNAMLFSTGPKSFNDTIRKDLVAAGWSWAIPRYFTHIRSNKYVSFNEERAAMKFLGINWISPRKRR